jgi:hypothetical protein
LSDEEEDGGAQKGWATCHFFSGRILKIAHGENAAQEVTQWGKIERERNEVSRLIQGAAGLFLALFFSLPRETNDLQSLELPAKTFSSSSSRVVRRAEAERGKLSSPLHPSNYRVINKLGRISLFDI